MKGERHLDSEGGMEKRGASALVGRSYLAFNMFFFKAASTDPSLSNCPGSSVWAFQLLLLLADPVLLPDSGQVVDRETIGRHLMLHVSDLPPSALRLGDLPPSTAPCTGKQLDVCAEGMQA